MEDLNNGAAQDKNAAATPDQAAGLMQQPEPNVGEKPAITDPLEAAVDQKLEAEKKEDAKAAVPDGGLLGGDKEAAKPGEGEKEAKKDGGEKSDDAPDYKFSLPDGFIENETSMAAFKDLAKKQGMKQEQAQAMLDAYIDIDRKRNAVAAEALAENSRKWQSEVKNHPEFGGTNLQASMESANAVLRKFGSPLLVSQMREMHIQDWPEMFYMLAKIHKSMGEDVSPGGESGGGAPSREESLKGLFPGIKS